MKRTGVSPGHSLIRFLKVSANIRIMVKQSARSSSSILPLHSNFSCYGRALSAARRHHNTFLYDTLVNKRTAPADSSNYTTIASVGPRSNHSGLESLPKASPLSYLCLLFHDLSLSSFISFFLEFSCSLYTFIFKYHCPLYIYLYTALYHA